MSKIQENVSLRAIDTRTLLAGSGVSTAIRHPRGCRFSVSWAPIEQPPKTSRNIPEQNHTGVFSGGFNWGALMSLSDGRWTKVPVRPMQSETFDAFPLVVAILKNCNPENFILEMIAQQLSLPYYQVDTFSRVEGTCINIIFRAFFFTACMCA